MFTSLLMNCDLIAILERRDWRMSMGCIAMIQEKSVSVRRVQRSYYTLSNLNGAPSFTEVLAQCRLFLTSYIRLGICRVSI
jgi:hypothetical protein